jgi:hypothetical protein
VGLVSGLAFEVREVFLWSAVPGVLVVAAAVVAVRNDPREHAPRVPPPPKKGAFSFASSGPLLAIFAPIFLSRLGSASELFLLLFAGRFVPLWTIPVLWGGLHLVKTLASFASAAATRWVGSRALVAAGWSAHAAVFGGFALAAIRWNAVFSGAAAAGIPGESVRAVPVPEPAVLAIVALFLAWGLYAGLCEGAEKDLVAKRAVVGHEGAAFGLYHLCVGVAALPASVGFGLLWDELGPAFAFSAGAACAGLAAVFLVIFPRFKGNT